MNKRFLFYRVAVILVSLVITILVIPRPGLALNMVTMSPNDYLQVVFNEPVTLDRDLAGAFHFSHDSREIPLVLHFVGQVTEGEYGAYRIFWLEPQEALAANIEYQLLIDDTLISADGETMAKPFVTAVRVSDKESQPEQPPLDPEDKGYSRRNPAPIGTTLSAEWSNYKGEYKANVTLLEVIRGERAWQMIYKANRFNDPPVEGYEYILARISFTYRIGPDRDIQYKVSPLDFTAVSSSGRDYDYASVIEPSPELSAYLYPGASIEGWATYQVEKTDAKPLLTFARDYRGTGGIWFKLY